MSKKKNDVSEFEDLFKDLKQSTEEVEALLEASKGKSEVKVEKKMEAPKEDVISYAFGIHKDLESGKWNVAEIHYNAATGKVSIHNECAISSTSKAVAQARATELMSRVALGLTLKNIRGYK